MLENVDLRTLVFDKAALAFSPIFEHLEFWENLAKNNHKPCYDQFELYDVDKEIDSSVGTKWANRAYLHFLRDRANNPLAPLQLGVPQEICDFLLKITPVEVSNITNFGYPLYKFRFTESFFDFVKNYAGDSELIGARYLHALMEHCPVTLKEYSKTITIQQYRSEDGYPLVKVLLDIGMRVAVASTLFPNLHAARIRRLYKEIYNKRSPSGQMPTAVEWYFNTERRRVHTTFFQFLLSLTYSNFDEAIPALIYAYRAYEEIAIDPILEIDRTPLLMNLNTNANRLVNLKTCPHCGTVYLTCATDSKFEHGKYYCIGCAPPK